MTKLIQLGLLPLLVFMAMGLGAPVMLAQDEDPALEEYVPDPKAKITVDFVQKDIHTVMHYVALRSGLQIIVEGDVNVKLTVMFRKVDPEEAIQSICKANKLDFIKDGSVIIVKQRPQSSTLANVVKADRTDVPEDEPDRFNVNFEAHSLVEAIMEVATVTGAQVFVPALPPQTTKLPDGGPQPGDTTGNPEDQTKIDTYVTQIQERKISIYMRQALPDTILKRLAEMGGLDIVPVTLDGSLPGSDTGWQFKYKPLDENPEGDDPVNRNDPLITDSWLIPGADMTKIKPEVTSLLSTRGKVVTDDVTDYIRVYDTEGNFQAIKLYLDALAVQMADFIASSAVDMDEMVVREYRMTRDASDNAFITSITAVLSDDGHLVANPDRNSIVVYERESLIKNIDRIMVALDAQPEQVLITAKLIEVSLDEYMGYGLELFTSHSADNLNNGRFTGSTQDTAQGTAGGLFGQPTGFDPFFATFSNPRIDVRLELLANEGRVETLSQPTQMVSNREQARIEIGQEVPYLASSGSTGGSTTASVSFKEVSIVMEVTPTVLENGLIRLDVIVTVREVIGNIAIEGNNTPVLSKRESQTNVFIRDGETLVMGGLMRERERSDENGLPFLKDIPFLGYLFKSANRTKSKTDLLFFLRPQIVNANNTGQISKIGEAVERDLRPLVYEEGDQKKANIRDGRYRKLGAASKPAWYNAKARPKAAKDVKPGA